MQDEDALDYSVWLFSSLRRSLVLEGIGTGYVAHPKMKGTTNQDAHNDGGSIPYTKLFITG